MFLGIHIVTAILDPFTVPRDRRRVVPLASSTGRFGSGSACMSVDLASRSSSRASSASGSATAWRAVHWVAYAAWPLAVLHTLRRGQRLARTWMLAITVALRPRRRRGLLWRLTAGGTNRSRLAARDRRHGRSGRGHAAATPAVEERLMDPRLLAGPPVAPGPRPAPTTSPGSGRCRAVAARSVIPALEASGLLGRGGAGFPVGRKWRSVAEPAGGGPVVLVNGAEGEPLSAKDRTLLRLRPHLVLDGALARGRCRRRRPDRPLRRRGARDARAAVRARPSRERPRPPGRRSTSSTRPPRYVAGEEIGRRPLRQRGDARPTTTPPRPYERGVGGRPTLVQNVESLAYAALIARFGDGWYRERGRGRDAGHGARHGQRRGPRRRPRDRARDDDRRAGREAGAGDGADDRQAVLLGGYFGGWLVDRARLGRAARPDRPARAGRAFGAGVVAFLGNDRCGVRATARIMDYMAGQSAAQCGPCVFGLRAIADATARLAAGRPERDDLERIERWSGQLAGRGACRHPDGAVGQLLSSLRVFGPEWEVHQRRGTCTRERSSDARDPGGATRAA